MSSSTMCLRVQEGKRKRVLMERYREGQQEKHMIILHEEAGSGCEVCEPGGGHV